MCIRDSNITHFVEFLSNHKCHDSLVKEIVKGQPDLLGQVAWAVEKEFALHLDDVLLRRTSLGLLGISTGELTIVADLMAKLLSWSPDKRNAEIEKAVSRQRMIHDTADAFYSDN